MKRLTSLILAIILFLLSLSAVSCSDSTGDDIPTDTATSTEEITTEAPTETEPPIPTNTFDISDFSIVCPDSDTALLAVSMELKDAIAEKTGAKIPIGRESKERENEIIIGNCNRDIAKEFFKFKKADIANKCGIIVDGSKIFLVGISVSEIKISAENFIEEYLGKSSKFEIEKKAERILDIPIDKTGIPKKNEKADLRLVSNNILHQSINKNTDRMLGLSFALKCFDADIVALQEVDEPWRTSCKIDSEMKKLGYAKVNVTNVNPIYYKEADFKVLEYKLESFTAIKSSYVWAVLEQISTKKRLMVASAHLVHGSDKAAIREECARQMISDTNKIASKYGAAIICAGDFNLKPDTVAYSIFKGEFNSGRDDSPVKVNMEYGTENVLGKSPKVGGAAIDHVFYSKNKIEPIHFETVVSPFTYSYADHVPVCFDFKLK